MAKSNNQTVPTKKQVSSFLKTIDKAKVQDCKRLIEIFRESTGEEAVMWGPAIIGFGSYHYVYESGREGDSTLAAFSPRKTAFAIYLNGFKEKESMAKSLGKIKGGRGCIYINKLEDIDQAVLKKMIVASAKAANDKHRS
jgi:hypothetical protein